jgi:catechol 2,3-dioxygenase-like lactoylglutathione lyase family enzyme
MPAANERAVGARLHLSLNVRDVARSRIFYEAFLGVPPHKVRPGYTNFQVDDPPLKLALMEGSAGGEKGALNHLGIQVGSQDQVEAARARLIAAGLATFDEQDALCCFARQDKVWVTDPDGNAWEIYVITDDLVIADELTEGELTGEEAAHPKSVPMQVDRLIALAPGMPPGGVPAMPVCCGEDRSGA